MSKNIGDVMAEIQNNRQLSTNLDDGSERSAGVGAQHQITDDADMRAGRYRQILGKCLNDAENNRLEEVHNSSRFLYT